MEKTEEPVEQDTIPVSAGAPETYTGEQQNEAPAGIDSRDALGTVKIINSEGRR
jgi:hypothetical protein